MTTNNKLRMHLYSSVGPALLVGNVARNHWRGRGPVYGSGSADGHANKVPYRGSNPGQSAAVFRHQLGQSGSRRILSR